MNLLLGLLPDLKKVAGTNGGEWAGACPWCNGKDRFRFWPEHPASNTGRWLCRQCQRTGDGIDLVRELKGVGYREACELLRIAPKAGKPSPRARQEKKPAAASPACDRLPSPTWQEQALIFLERARQSLGRPEARQELERRGLTLQEAQALGLGWSLGEWHERTAWGLPEGKRMRLARGLVVPVWRGDKLLRLKIRRADETEAAQFGKWQAVAGGGNGPLVVGKAGAPVVVLEAEIDALAVFVGLGGACAAVGLGSVANRPTVESEPWLRSASRILVALDRDEAGAKAAAWWLASYRAALRWGATGAKSPADMPRDSLRLWYAAGLQAQADKGLSSCRADSPTPSPPSVVTSPGVCAVLCEVTTQYDCAAFVENDELVRLSFRPEISDNEQQSAVAYVRERLSALAEREGLSFRPSDVWSTVF